MSIRNPSVSLGSSYLPLAFSCSLPNVCLNECLADIGGRRWLILHWRSVSISVQSSIKSKIHYELMLIVMSDLGYVSTAKNADKYR